MRKREEAGTDFWILVSGVAVFH